MVGLTHLLQSAVCANKAIYLLLLQETKRICSKSIEYSSLATL